MISALNNYKMVYSNRGTYGGAAKLFEGLSLQTNCTYQGRQIAENGFAHTPREFC